jgi:hypothetical protein
VAASPERVTYRLGDEKDMPLQNGNESAYHQRRAIEQALEIDGPAIIDCVVAQDELPNFPHMEVDQAKNYVVAKVKEAMLSFVDH